MPQLTRLSFFKSVREIHLTGHRPLRVHSSVASGAFTMLSGHPSSAAPGGVPATERPARCAGAGAGRGGAGRAGAAPPRAAVGGGRRPRAAGLTLCRVSQLRRGLRGPAVPGAQPLPQRPLQERGHVPRAGAWRRAGLHLQLPPGLLRAPVPDALGQRLPRQPLPQRRHLRPAHAHGVQVPLPAGLVR